MKILVTGGAGYIGSHTIIDILNNTNHEVVSIDNFSNAEPQVFDRIKEITGKEVVNHAVDLCDKESLQACFEELGNIDGIIHFAALKAVGESVSQPVAYYQNNFNSLLNLLELSAGFHVQHFIFSSSCTVYGNAEVQPVTEETPLQEPESPYGYTKLAGERMLRDFVSATADFNALSLRYFNPVGAHPSGLNGELPKGRPNNLVPVVTQFASGWLKELWVHGNDYDTRDGTAIRDYIHVSDIAHAHVLAMEWLVENQQSKYDVFNLGTGTGVTVLEVLQAFMKASGIQLNYQMGPRRAGDVEVIYADNTKARTILGWEPRFNIFDAMDAAWKWQQRLNDDSDHRR